MTHMTHQDGGDQQRRLRVGEEVEETVQVELFADLGVAVVPRHEVDQGEATHQGDPLELPTRFFCVSTSQTLHLFPCSPIDGPGRIYPTCTLFRSWDSNPRQSESCISSRDLLKDALPNELLRP